MRMKTVGIRTLKNRLSEYLRAAQSGERIAVTRRGVPVGDVVPQAPPGLDPDEELLRLARAGEVRLGRSDSDSGVQYTRPPRERRLAHDELMAILSAVGGDRQVDSARRPVPPPGT